MQRKAKTQEAKALKQTQVRRAYQDIFGSPKGKIVLFDLMREHDLLSTPRSLDHATLAYSEGEKAVIKRIMVYLNTDVQNLEERIREYVKEMEE